MTGASFYKYGWDQGRRKVFNNGEHILNDNENEAGDRGSGGAYDAPTEGSNDFSGFEHAKRCLWHLKYQTGKS